MLVLVAVPVRVAVAEAVLVAVPEGVGARVGLRVTVAVGTMVGLLVETGGGVMVVVVIVVVIVVVDGVIVAVSEMVDTGVSVLVTGTTLPVSYGDGLYEACARTTLGKNSRIINAADKNTTRVSNGSR